MRCKDGEAKPCDSRHFHSSYIGKENPALITKFSGEFFGSGQMSQVNQVFDRSRGVGAHRIEVKAFFSDRFLQVAFDQQLASAFLQKNARKCAKGHSAWHDTAHAGADAPYVVFYGFLERTTLAITKPGHRAVADP